jgi:hypothetical protein
MMSKRPYSIGNRKFISHEGEIEFADGTIYRSVGLSKRHKEAIIAKINQVETRTCPQCMSTLEPCISKQGRVTFVCRQCSADKSLIARLSKLTDTELEQRKAHELTQHFRMMGLIDMVQKSRAAKEAK